MLNLRHEPTAPLCRFDWLRLGIVCKPTLRSACTIVLCYTERLSSLAPMALRSSKKNYGGRNFKPSWYIRLGDVAYPELLTTKKPSRIYQLGLKRRLPTLPRENRSTIGVSELNFSVRNGKRWNLTAITT